MPSAIALDHLEQAAGHLREAAACVRRQHPELAAIFWQYAESLSGCDLDSPVFSFTLAGEFVLEVGCEIRHTFEGPLWLTIIVPPRDV